MKFFRFDKSKEDFKGSEHKSVFMGDEVYNYCDDLFENGEAPNEYQARYNDGDFDVIDDYIDDCLTLNGCSCFEFSDNGINEALKEYSAFFDIFNVVTIFEGEFIEYGHDGELIAKCDKILEQISPEEFKNKYCM